MRWFPWTDNGVTKTEIAFDRSSGTKKLVVRQVTRAEPLNLLLNANEAQANQTSIKALLRGNTQRHRVPIARIDEATYWQWRRELGDPHKDYQAAQRWKQRLNDHNFRSFRTSEGRF